MYIFFLFLLLSYLFSYYELKQIQYCSVCFRCFNICQQNKKVLKILSIKLIEMSRNMFNNHCHCMIGNTTIFKIFFTFALFVEKLHYATILFTSKRKEWQIKIRKNIALVRVFSSLERGKEKLTFLHLTTWVCVVFCSQSSEV